MVGTAFSRQKETLIHLPAGNPGVALDRPPDPRDGTPRMSTEIE